MSGRVVEAKGTIECLKSITYHFLLGLRTISLSNLGTIRRRNELRQTTSCESVGQMGLEYIKDCSFRLSHTWFSNSSTGDYVLYKYITQVTIILFNHFLYFMFYSLKVCLATQKIIQNKTKKKQ